MGQPPPEQRRTFRFAATFRLEASGTDTHPAESHALRDISAAGMRMTSSEPLAVGQIVDIRFPDVDAEFVAQGTVIWCEQRGEHHYEIGLHFDEKAPEYEQLCTRVREIEKYRRTVEDLRGSPLPPEEAARQWNNRFGSLV